MTTKQPDNSIGLALSGGGFRATLFHLGVVRFLFETNLLESVKLVSSVSGGSILAAHLILNWTKYKDPKDFDAAAREVIDFVQADIRGQVIRRWILGRATRVLRVPLISLLQRQYAGLFRVPNTPSGTASDAPAAGADDADTAKATVQPTEFHEATLKDLRGSGRPAVRFNCTSLSTGDAWYFDQVGFGRYKDGVIEAPIAAPRLQVAYAVSASSAFPPFFPPVDISRATLGCDRQDFEHEHRLTDGGVYDNLGIKALTARYVERRSGDHQNIPLGGIIVSDAEGNFDSDFDAEFASPLNRNIRANDLLMKRVSDLQLEYFAAGVHQTSGGGIPFPVRVSGWFDPVH